MSSKSKLINILATGALAAVPLVGMGATPASATDFSTPGVYLCQDANYQGTCLYYGAGDVGELGWANDVFSSIKIVGNFAVQVYQNTWYGGNNEDYFFDASNLANMYIGNDSISSIKVRAVTQAEREGIYLYINKDGTGQWLKYTSDQPTFPVLPNGYRYGSNISSIRIEGPYDVTLYSGLNYTGSSLFLQGFGPTYGYTNLDPLGWNDKPNSIKMTHR